MKAYVRFIPVFLMLFLFVQVGAPPTSDNEKKVETRSDPGSAGDSDQAKEKEQNRSFFATNILFHHSSTKSNSAWTMSGRGTVRMIKEGYSIYKLY